MSPIQKCVTSLTLAGFLLSSITLVNALLPNRLIHPLQDATSGIHDSHEASSTTELSIEGSKSQSLGSRRCRRSLDGCPPDVDAGQEGSTSSPIHQTTDGSHPSRRPQLNNALSRKPSFIETQFAWEFPAIHERWNLGKHDIERVSVVRGDRSQRLSLSSISSQLRHHMKPRRSRWCTGFLNGRQTGTWPNGFRSFRSSENVSPISTVA